MNFNHQLYEDIVLGIGTAADVAILFSIIWEGRKVRREIRVSNETIRDATEDLQVNERVSVREAQIGVPQEQWPWGTAVWVIRQVNAALGTAIATPLLPPLEGPTPRVEGPMHGPNRAFKKMHIPS
jgi:hypothetical protein